MFKILFATCILVFSLYANNSEEPVTKESTQDVPTDVLYEKVENLIGTREFNTHKNLVDLLFRNKQNYYANEHLNYIAILKQLKENGLLKLRLKQPKEITVEFLTNADPIKSLKILNDTLKSLGYYYYFTKKTLYDGEGNLVWTIRLKTSYAIDPFILSKELARHEVRVIDITRAENDAWQYSINTAYANIDDAIFIDTNEKVILRKPLKPYFIKINEAKTLKIISRTLNNWYPHVVFYDKHLNVLKIVKKDRMFKGLTISIPETSRYIKVTDLYTLINIKRGLSIITKE